MNAIGSEQYIKDGNGNIEFVVMPYDEYSEIKEILEDYGLGLSMLTVEKQPSYSKDEALRMLEDNRH